MAVHEGAGFEDFATFKRAWWPGGRRVVPTPQGPRVQETLGKAIDGASYRCRRVVDVGWRRVIVVPGEGQSNLKLTVTMLRA